MAEAEADIVYRLREKVRICDAALASVVLRTGDQGRIERAIREIRADAVRELRTRGLDVTDEPAG